MSFMQMFVSGTKKMSVMDGLSDTCDVCVDKFEHIKCLQNKDCWGQFVTSIYLRTMKKYQHW